MTREKAIEVVKEAMPTLWKETKDAIQTLIPELKESEDERIRSCICLALTDVDEQRFTDFGVTLKDCLAYLEKQKKQKLIISAEESLGISPEEYNKIVDECIFGEQKEQKPVCGGDFKWTSQDERCRSKLIEILELADIKYPATKDSRDELWEWLKELPMKFPNKDAFMAGTLDNDDELSRTEEILGVDGNPTYYKQKPIEWSENFEENIRNLLHDKLTGYSENWMTWTTFIDDKTLKDIVNGIWFYVGKEALKYPNKELNTTEWSKENETHRAFILESLEDQIRFCKKNAEGAHYAKQIRAAQNWLKSLRPQSHWKPSEAQMEALQIAATISKTDFNTLTSLLIDLKKL